MADRMQNNTPGLPGTTGNSTGSAAPRPERSDSGREVASRAVDEVKGLGNELVNVIRDSATSLIDEQRGRAADEIASLGEMLRNTAQSFDERAGSGLGEYAKAAAEEIAGFAETVRGRSWSDLAADIEGFAREWPIAFMAAAIAGGFVGGRLLLASPRGSAASVDKPATTPEPFGGAERTGGMVGYNATTGAEPR